MLRTNSYTFVPSYNLPHPEKLKLINEKLVLPIYSATGCLPPD